MIRQELPLRQGQGITCTRFVITFADLAALVASTGPQSITLQDAGGNLFQVAQGGLVTPGIRAKLDVAFVAPALTALTNTIGQVGDTTNNTFFSSTAFNLMGAVGDNTSILEVSLFKAGQDAAFNINVTFTGDGTHNLNTVTAGQFHIDIFVAQFGPINVQSNPPAILPAP
jgi:hypothetical protein